MSDVLAPPRPHHPAGRVAPRIGAIDCDVHPAVPRMKALLPHLPPHWAEQVTLRGVDGLDLASYPHRVPANTRPDWRPATGKLGSDPDQVIAQALDGFGSRLAVLNCLYGIEPLHNADMAAALARAVNEWIAREWLDRDKRLRASILLPLQNTELAVAELERAAADMRFVQVLALAMGEAPLGSRRYWPIWEAADRHGLALGIHAGSAYRHAISSNGWPSYYLEDTVVQSHAFQAQLLSLVNEGVFTRLPNFRVVLMESGFTWLPQFLWRATRTWRAMRAEVPWVDRAPADIIREHVRITLQPTDAPPRPEDLTRAVEQIGSDRMLLFSTDYPHWHFDGQEALPAGLSDALIRRILVDNPLETYPRLREGSA